MSITDRNNLGFDYESPAYRFGSLETQANNCLCVPIVYGKARAAGNKIWQSPGSDTFSALVCFAEGQITGFSDIRINDILITDSAISGCNCTAYVGNGTQELDKDPVTGKPLATPRIPGTTQADKAALVGGLKHTAYLALTIKSGTKVANNYLDVSAVLQGKAVRIFSSLPAEYTTELAGNNNDLKFTVSDYVSIEYRKPDSPDQALSSSINTNNEIVVSLATDSSGNISSTANQVMQSLQSNTDISGKVTVALAPNNDGSGLVTALAKHTIGYTDTYSNNPVWCILDFLTCHNGCGLSYSDIDLSSFISAATYCDAKINPVNATGTVSVNTTPNLSTVTGSGTKFLTEVKAGNQITVNGENKIVAAVSSDTFLTVDSNFSSALIGQTMVVRDTRYTLNLILDTRKTRQDWLNEMLICCRGFFLYKGSKIALIIEQDASSLQSFTQDDIIADSETFWTTPKEQRCDIFKIRYLDPSNQYARAYAVAEAEEFFNDPPIVQEIVAFGITNFKQASRLAWFYLNQANTCDKFFSFMTTKMGLDRTPGDVIDITSTFMGYENKKLTIVSMTEVQEGQIQLICREFNSALYVDTLGSVAPVINTVNINDVLDTPDDVQNLSSAQNLNSIVLTWQTISNPIATYEIREGSSWNNSSVIAKNLTGSSYTVLNIQKGTYKYWIKSVNKYGNYAENARLSTIIITDLPETNTIVNENILDDDLSVGTFVDCHASYSRVVLNSVKTWASSGTWDNMGKDYAPDGSWGSECEQTGLYTTKVYDLGTILDSLISVNYNLSSTDNDSNLIVEWNYSEDNVNWSGWQVFAQGSYRYRYYQFRVTLNSPDNKYTALTSFIVNIDITNRDLYFQDQAISSANDGVTVNFNPAFTNIPAVVANISDGTSGYCVVSAKTTSQATVKAYNNSGTAITAHVDIRVKGY